MEGRIERKQVNYGRQGEGHVDIKDFVDKYDKNLIAGKTEKPAYKLMGEAKPEGQTEGELSATELKAVTDNLRKQYAAVESARKNTMTAGLDEATREKLKQEVESLKSIILEENGITEDMYALSAADNVDVQRSKKMLAAAVEYIKAI